ncbi:MAG: ferredoxin [Faecalibacterium sp.]|nr:ferredoxin [Faecalibacterium sp.]
MIAYVDPQTCIGCTRCAELCPEIFEMQGILAMAQPGQIPGEYAARAAEAAQSCPVDAIRLINC